MSAADEILEQCFAKKPPGWREGSPWGSASVWDNLKKHMRVLAEVEVKDGQRWLHLSMSRLGKMPTYEDMCYLKRHWAGPAAKAIEIHAPEDEHVNIHMYCRHLWAPLDEDPIPDMRKQCDLTGIKAV